MVKQEPGAGAIVAPEPASPLEITVKLDMRVLHFPICSRPFKPPIFRCKGVRHTACESCLAEIPDKQCQKCEQGGDFERCPGLEKVVSSTKIECAHDGCGIFVAYHDAQNHQSVCPHAPCSCTELGCSGFQGAPAALLYHVVDQHAMQLHWVPHARATKLHLPAEPRRHLVIVEGDGGAFLLTVTTDGSLLTTGPRKPRPKVEQERGNQHLAQLGINLAC